MKIQTTREAVAEAGPQILCYAPSKFGKTSLIGTLPHGRTLVLASEDGLRPLGEFDIAVAPITSPEDLRESYRHIQKNIGDYDWVCVDSITELADMVLAAELEATEHRMRAYGEMATKVLGFVRALKRLKCGLYITAHCERVRDEASGNMLFGPASPGQQVSQKLPYLFEQVFTIRITEDADGQQIRLLQTRSDQQYSCGDRSGRLEPLEPCDLSAIDDKIRGSAD